jgi:hypothetical protein
VAAARLTLDAEAIALLDEASAEGAQQR